MKRMDGRAVIFIFALVIIANLIGSSVGKRKFLDPHEVEIQRSLKKFNKAAVKSFQSPDGDIFDCVSIRDQPTFDHPLMKNHTIQMKPSWSSEAISGGDEREMRSLRQSWHRNGEYCPELTVPIKRRTREDLLRSDALMEAKAKLPIANRSYAASIPGHEYANMRQHGKFLGTNAEISVWNPTVRTPEEFSLAQIWVSDVQSEHTNVLEVGWQVFPMKYNDDSRLKLFVYYTCHDYLRGSGCYNLDCPGFVQVDNKIALGGSIAPLSAYGGGQHVIFVQIRKDTSNGNWWVQVQDVNVGYWPSSLVPGLADHATQITWGGEVYTTLQPGDPHTTTQMGSGHFGKEGFGKAAFFSKIRTIDPAGKEHDPKGYKSIESHPHCYDIVIDHVKDPDWGTHFYFGGPGRNEACP